MLSGCNAAEESGSTFTTPEETSAASISGYDFADEDDIFTNECDISLGDTVSINGEGAWLDGSCITISEGGVYTLSGVMSDGKIKIESADPVKLILNGASVTNKSGIAISADEGKLIIECAEGTVNSLSSYGEKKEALKCDGTLFMESGSLSIFSEDDGIKVESDFFAENVKLDIKCGREDNGEAKGKGIKAGKLTLTDCDITVNSADHSVKSDGETVVNGGAYNLSSLTGKGIASVDKLSLNGADIIIPRCVEGIESKSAIDINGGNISITASDDGINTGGEENSDNTMSINGGNITVNAEGDGLDSNGDINITGGTVIVFGNDKGGESPVDCGERFSINISGGKLIAFGSMDMQSRPDGEYTMSRSLSGVEGDKIIVSDENGNEIISVELPKSAKGIFYCGEGAENVAVTKNGSAVTLGESVSGVPFKGGKPSGFQGGEPPAGNPPQKQD